MDITLGQRASCACVIGPPAQWLPLPGYRKHVALPLAAAMTPPITVRIWDLPTRIFHWALAIFVVALVVTAKVGGNAMEWHFRFGYSMLALLVFRIVWGLIGGRWSRFTAFVYSPARVMRYLRGAGHPDDSVGHSPLGALSVFGLLGVLIAQVASGLLSDDEIAFSGPLTRFVSNATVNLATGYHKEIGQFLVLGLVALHILAIIFYVVVRKQTLVKPMVIGDKPLPATTKPSRDDAVSRAAALVVFALSASLAWWVSSLAAAGF